MEDDTVASPIKKGKIKSDEIEEGLPNDGGMKFREMIMPPSAPKSRYQANLPDNSFKDFSDNSVPDYSESPSP